MSSSPRVHSGIADDGVVLCIIVTLLPTAFFKV